MKCLQDDVCCCCMTVNCLQHLTMPCMPQAKRALHYESQAGIVTRQEKKHLCFLIKGVHIRKERPEDEVHWGTLSMCLHQHL